MSLRSLSQFGRLRENGIVVTRYVQDVRELLKNSNVVAGHASGQTQRKHSFAQKSMTLFARMIQVANIINGRKCDVKVYFRIPDWIM